MGGGGKRRLVVVLTAMSAVATGLGVPEATAGPATSGRWADPFKVSVRTIHTTMLPGGRILLFSRPRSRAGTEARIWNPNTKKVTNVSLTSRTDIYCGGHSLLPDGRLFVAGGQKYNSDLEVGIRNTTTFNPKTLRWSRGPLMDFPRWYPTTTMLPDGDILIFNGQLNQEGQDVATVQRYDPNTGGLTTLPNSADKPFQPYPRMHLLPDGTIFKSGPEGQSWSFNPASSTWTQKDKMGFDSRYAGTSVLLPIQGDGSGPVEILTAGGTHGRVGSKSAEIIDARGSNPQWRYTGSMNYGRLHHNATLLPDGKVLVVGGGRRAPRGDPVRRAEIYNPVNESWKVMASQEATRMYHATAILLEDGRVLSAGQDIRNPLATFAEVFSPPYLFKGTRPRISDMPKSAGYGSTFEVSGTQISRISKVMLMRPGSVTHSVDFDQRAVRLAFTKGSSSLTVTAPISGSVAPPGWYMLFLVNDAGVPSIASWVRLLG